MTAGKGSNRRPTDEQKFRENFDRIFGKKDEKPTKKPSDDKNTTGRFTQSSRVG
jgi:hypothetical protein